MTASTSPEYWIFGYGSLIYKPPDNFDRAVPGYIVNHIRRFWQSSNDHRGTPEAPGRVVTLIKRDFYDALPTPDHHPEPPGNKVWGIAYRIRADVADQVRRDLDHREKNGYTVEEVDFHFHGASDEDSDVDPTGKDVIKTRKCSVYIGTPDNEAFVGNVETPEQLARHILQSCGPSGENREYLYRLHDSLLELHSDARDFHIQELVRLAKAIEKEEGLGKGN